MNHEAVEKAQAYILKNWRKRPSLVEIASHCGLSLFYLHRIFHRQTGITTKEMRTRCQIEEAKRLLATDMPLAKIATEVGFSHQPHFTARFRELTGQTPGGFRKALKMAKGK